VPGPDHTPITALISCSQAGDLGGSHHLYARLGHSLSGDDMKRYICETCGVEYADSESPPDACMICEDERQYIGLNGQRWTTMAQMKDAGFKNEVKEKEPGLLGIGIVPVFSIGQRALLVQTSEGNILYDCISLIDDETIDTIRSLGGIQGICLSHPTSTTP
jgi:hypothetical protein